MKRHKISKNFYADEFIHPYLYKKIVGMGLDPKLYINRRLVGLIELIRKNFNDEARSFNANHKDVGLYINTWWSGGHLKNSGLRTFLQPHKKGSLSRHYFNECADLHLNGGGDEQLLYNHILRYKDFYFYCGLTTLEDFDFTPAWVHVSMEWRTEESIYIMKP